LILNSKPNQNFCYADQSIAKDDISLRTYLQILQSEDPATKADLANKVDPAKKPNVHPLPNTIFLVPSQGRSTNDVLSKPPYVIKIYQFSVDPNGTNPKEVSQGTIHSKTMGTGDPKTLTLAGLRKLISSKTSMWAPHLTQDRNTFVAQD
jgi:hypothetical protein